MSYDELDEKLNTSSHLGRSHLFWASYNGLGSKTIWQWPSIKPSYVTTNRRVMGAANLGPGVNNLVFAVGPLHCHWIATGCGDNADLWHSCRKTRPVAMRQSTQWVRPQISFTGLRSINLHCYLGLRAFNLYATTNRNITPTTMIINLLLLFFYVSSSQMQLCHQFHRLCHLWRWKCPNMEIQIAVYIHRAVTPYNMLGRV